VVTLPGPPAIFVRADAHLRMWGIAQYNAASPTPAMFLVMRKRPLPREFIVSCRGRLLMNTPTTGSLEELTVNERLIAHGPHRPLLVVHNRNRVLALDNTCPHMGFPLDRCGVNGAP
jgi:hypothetical protein